MAAAFSGRTGRDAGGNPGDGDRQEATSGGLTLDPCKVPRLPLSLGRHYCSEPRTGGLVLKQMNTAFQEQLQEIEFDRAGGTSTAEE